MLQPEKACLLIADISGYTEYLSGVEIDHAQDILADLISTIVTSLRPNFRLSKLEGDAAFCFAPTEKVDGSILLDTIERCYFGFRRRRRDIRQATSCECNACTRIPDLGLKFVAHHGLVIRQKIAGHEELLGSDVIAVHRLLKNDIVEKTGITAYAAFTDRLITEMGVDPGALSMREHTEAYEHLGEIKLWILDLEQRWQEEDSRQRVYVSAAEAMFQMAIDIPAPPQVVWEYVTTPGRRMEWQSASGITGVEQTVGAGGRRGVGTVNHCMHGPAAQVEEVLDWRPFDYFSFMTRMPGGGPAAITMYEMEPTSNGTILRFRMAPPKTAKERKILEEMAPHLSAGITVAMEVLTAKASSESDDRSRDRMEPPLPHSRNTDGFLESIQPA